MENETIAQIVAKDYKTAAVFKKFNIDFCCGGKVSLHDVCKQKNINKEELLKALRDVQKENVDANRVEALELDALADHIVDTHHSYVREKITEIEPFLSKVVRVHGTAHPELQKVQELFTEVAKELLSHAEDEETVLFPYIKELIEAKNKDVRPQVPSFGSIQTSIDQLEQEHEFAGDGFKHIRKITNDLAPPENACNTYRVTFSMLRDFENDLHRHIHLENNILFPKAAMLEKELTV